MIIQDEDQRKDQYDNLINMIKALSCQYINAIQKIVNYRFELLNANKDKVQIQKTSKLDRQKMDLKFKQYRETIRKMYKQLILNKQKNSRQPFAVQDFNKIRQEDKCFEELNHGIRFIHNAYNSEIIISLYLIRDGEICFSEYNKKLQKRLEIFLNQKYRKNGSSIIGVFNEIKKFYFDFIKKTQVQGIACQICKQILRYCITQNSFMSPSLFIKQNMNIRYFHESCQQQDRQQMVSRR